MYIVLSVLLGVLIGALLPWSIPAQYSIYAAVMLLAALDAAAGGIDARLHHKFRGSLFVSGALGNGLIAVFLTYMGERIGICKTQRLVVCINLRRNHHGIWFGCRS